MAPNPLACSHRITVPITVDGLLHKQRLFVKAVAGGIDYQLEHQLSSNADWQDDIEHYLGLLVPSFNSVATIAPVVLEELIFGAYVPISFYTPTADQGTGSGGYVTAGQATFTFRDTLIRKAKILWLESREPLDLHVTTASLVGGSAQPWVDDIMLPAGPNDAGFWLRSRSEAFLSSFVAFTTTDNDKLRRARNVL